MSGGRKLIFLFLLVFYGAARCESADSLQELVTSQLNPYLDQHYSVSVGVLQDRVTRSFHFSQHAEEPVPDENSIFNINSMTKVMVDVVLLQMALEGKLKVADPVQKFYGQGLLPTFDGTPITFFSLATQSSGLPLLPDNMGHVPPYNPYGNYTDKQMFEYLARAELGFRPETQYHYSNLGFGFLGCMLASIDGRSFAEMMDNRFSKPLNLPDTHPYVDLATESRLKKGHTPAGEPVPPRSSSECFLGSWAMRSTVKDVLAFLGHQLRPELSPLREVIEQTQQPTAISQGGDTVIGYGWDIRLSDRTYSKTGSGGGFSSIMLFNRQKQLGAVLLSTSNPQDSTKAISQPAWKIMNELLRSTSSE